MEYIVLAFILLSITGLIYITQFTTRFKKAVAREIRMRTFIKNKDFDTYNKWYIEQYVSEETVKIENLFKPFNNLYRGDENITEEFKSIYYSK
jgi:hypothetical protein